ncbi:MAG: LD-carboxypeptidase [Pirellulales bacterium]|nr:LD-carboxypeptidase [Pirellulales bacterium]
MPNVIKPKALKVGDTIGAIAPAGPVDRDRLESAIARLAFRGFQVKTYGDLYRSRGYLAGDDATRAAEFNAAFADPETSAVWCARGGYGTLRILDRIDYSAIAQSRKLLYGFSDITALHTAIGQRTGLITLHGPNLQDGFGKQDFMPVANEAALWRITRAELASSTSGGYPYDFSCVEGLDLQTIHGGITTGRLIGGNLAVLCGMLGTPFEPETAGRILFLEDIGERLYRIDRFLTQLRLAGKLQSLAGVLLGGFSYAANEQAENPSDVAALLTEVFAPLGVPVLAGFPAGHDRFNLALPLGALAQLDADAKQLTLLESVVNLD